MRKREQKLHLSQEAAEILVETARRTGYTMSIIVDMLLRKHARSLGEPEEPTIKTKRYAFNG